MVVKFNHLLPAMPELGMGLPNAYWQLRITLLRGIRYLRFATLPEYLADHGRAHSRMLGRSAARFMRASVPASRLPTGSQSPSIMVAVLRGDLLPSTGNSKLPRNRLDCSGDRPGLERTFRLINIP